MFFLSFLLWNSSLNSKKTTCGEQMLWHMCGTFGPIIGFTFIFFPSNSEWDLTNRPLDKLQELLDIQV